MKRFKVFIFALWVAACAFGQEAVLASDTLPVVRPVMASYMIEFGSAHLRDTYLTPIQYNGWSVGLTYERMQAMRFDPEKWVMRLDARLSLDKTDNPADMATMWAIDFRPSWSMMRRWKPFDDLTLAVGGNVGIDLGALYLYRNSNNPVSARAAFTVGLTGFAAYNLTLGKLPITFRYQPTMPLTGVFFSPDYDELYYEIWLGNHSGLCHGAWWGNYFRIDNLLTADLRLGNTVLRLGYRCDYFSTKVSGIVTQSVNHSFVLGVTTEFLSVRPGATSLERAKIISSLY